MTCDHVELLLTEFTRRQLPADERRAVASHLADCQGCRAALQQTKRLSALLRQAAPVEQVNWGRVAACMLVLVYWLLGPLWLSAVTGGATEMAQAMRPAPEVSLLLARRPGEAAR